MWREFPQMTPEEFRQVQEKCRIAIERQLAERPDLRLNSLSLPDVIAHILELTDRTDVHYAVLSHTVPAGQAYEGRDASGERYVIFSASIRDHFPDGGAEGGLRGLPVYRAEAMPPGWPMLAGRFTAGVADAPSGSA